MPELPEVATIVKGLNKLIREVSIEKTIIKEEKLIGYPDPEGFKKNVDGERIIEFSRRGKYILCHLSGEKTVVIHLRMTGKLLVMEREEKYDKHTHVIFELTDGRDLRFNNIRKFGRLYLINKEQRDKAGGLAELGPEPLAEDFSAVDFGELFTGRKACIKSLLLNQRFLAGLGNIYCDEALFRAEIAPDRKADTLSDEEIERLYRAIRQVLRMGIKYKGTSFSDYVNAMGEAGDFQERLQVYQQEDEKCPRCGCSIVRDKISGRSTHYCPECQQ